MNLATGRSIHRKMRFLEQSQWWPRERLEAYQLAKLQRLIRHVYERVPFYSREMRKRGLRPEDFTSLAVLREMPIVTKSMLQENPRDFLAAGYRLEDLIVGSTSGSTGQPTRFYRTREQDSWHWALKYRMWGMAGYRLGEPYVNIYNMARNSVAKGVQDLLLRNRAFYIFAEPNQNALLDRIIAVLSRREVRFLAGCTSTIRILADRYAERGLPPPKQLRAILCTGSLLTQPERRFIESQLGAPMWDHYGLGGEGIHVAAECELKRGYHVNVENLVLEPRHHGAESRGAAAGALVTALDNFAWPLIRYDTGDAILFTQRRCACGRGLPLIERVDGRIVDTVTLPSGVRLNEHYFSVLFGEISDIAQYQVEQTAPDQLLVRLVWRSEPSAVLKERIARTLMRVASCPLVISFADASAIPLSPSGKHRNLIARQRRDNV